jgi:hypothetical protein
MRNEKKPFLREKKQQTTFGFCRLLINARAPADRELFGSFFRERTFFPAALIALCAALVPATAALLPMGETMMVVRVAPDGGAARAAAAAGAALVRVPAPGYAVLWGDAARARRALGLVADWKGIGPCTNLK